MANRLACLIIMVLLSACAPRGVVQIVPGAGPVHDVQPVFVGTTRAPDPRTGFGSGRSAQLSFARYDISIPENHTPGEIEWPNGAVDPTQDFFATSGIRYADDASFRTALGRTLGALPANERIAVVYVHGFNNTYAEGIYRIAQLRQDVGLPGVAVHYSWPSAGSPLGYAHDRDSLLFARDGLEEMLGQVRAAGAREILLIGHSLGALLAMETLRQMDIGQPGSSNRLLSGVVLISPDIDVTVFRQQVSRIQQLPQPFAIFSSSRDRALRLSARLTGQSDRLGTITDAAELSDLQILVFDVSEFTEGATGHFNAATSPALLQILRLLPGIEAAFTNDRSGRAGLLPGTIITVQNATQIVLSPISD